MNFGMNYNTETSLFRFQEIPAQGFSTSNTKTRNSNNSNNSLFWEYIRQVDELSPDWFVFENVEGIKSFDNGTVINRLEEEFKKIRLQN